VRCQAGEQRGVAGGGRSRLIQDNNVEACQLFAMLPERFSHETFQAIAPCRVLAVLLAYRKPQPCFVAIVWPVEDCKHVVATSTGIREYATEGLLVEQAVSTPETMIGNAADFTLVFRDEPYLLTGS
jgi:hypothetical protein